MRTSCTPEHVEKMTTQRGWFQTRLWQMEDLLNGRWGYWLAICMNGTVGQGPEWAIPQLNFAAHFENGNPTCARFAELTANEHGRKVLEMVGGPAEARKHALKLFEEGLDHGGNSLQQLVDWWLWGFGSNRLKERPRVSERGALAMYSGLELHRLVGNPADWGSAVMTGLEQTRKGSAWFPTPMHVARMMTKMTFEADGRDTRLLSVLEPCVGTGVFLLEASNYSLDLSGVDIDPLMCSWCEFAGWLFMPWLVWGNKSMIREFRERQQVAAPAIATAEPVEPPKIQLPSVARQGKLFALEAARGPA